MENTEKSVISTTPTKYLTNCYLTRLGTILSNMAIVCVIFCMSSILSSILSVLLWILGMMLILATLGSIFALIPNYWNKLVSLMEQSSQLIEKLIKVLPYIASVGLACAIASIVLLAMDKNKKHTGRIIFSIVASIIILIVIFVLIIGGGK